MDAITIKLHMRINLMKKFLSIALNIVMTICLFIGCSQKKIKANKKIKIGVSLTNIDDKYVYYLYDEIKEVL